MIKRDYTDELGIVRTVLIPHEYTPPSEGLPCSIILDAYLEGCSVEFAKNLYNAFRERNLIEPKDFLAPGADSLILAALRSVLKLDVQVIQEVARSQNGNKRR